MSWGPRGLPDLPLHRNTYVEFTSPQGHRYLCDSGLSKPEVEHVFAALIRHGNTNLVLHVGLPSRKELPKATFVSRWWYT